jgi:pyruvate dehydrogenase E2 component (dihydrolipoamide acetyltransferase)
LERRIINVAINVTMPKWGLTMKEGKVTKWYKNEGDSVQKGEDLFEVETEKITNKVESPGSGTLFQIVVPVGTTVAVGAILAVIAEPGEHPERIEGVQVSEVIEAAGASSQGAVATEKPQEKKFVPASPAARRLAKELGIDLALVQGTGPDGRTTEADVGRYHEEGPPAPKITPLAEEMVKQEGLDISAITGTGEGGKVTKEDVKHALERRTSIPLTGMRKTIADNMYASLQNTAQLTVFTEVDVTEMVRFRDLVQEEYKKDETVKVSFNDIVILATSRALKRFPMMNSALIGDEILLYDAVNMGIAVSLREGLIVPVLRDADKKGLLQIARESRELAQKARDGTLTVDDVTGGTFTISNVSMLEVDGFTPILRPPETGILGVGRVKEKPVVYEGEIAIRSMMFLSLTFDHRVLDGTPAMAFLETVARYLQHPALIMA